MLRNLAGFRIYFGQTVRDLDRTIAITNPSVSTYLVENLSEGTWYFGVTAVNAYGVESPLSNLASKTIS